MSYWLRRAIACFKNASGDGGSERRKLKSDQLAASATLASGFAHEIGTPLGIIRGLAEMLMTGTFEPAEITDSLDVIITQIDEISRMVRLLLDIGRSRSAIRIASDVRTIAESTIQLLKPEAAPPRRRSDRRSRLPAFDR